MRSPASRTFSFLSGILIGMLAAVGMMFLILNQYNPMRMFYKSESLADSDTIVDMRKLATQKAKTTTVIFDGEKKANEKKASDSSLNLVSETKEEPIVVKRDELIASYELKLIVASESNSNRQDSLINLLQGGSPLEWFRLDLFRSPLNFTGYKMTGSKIIVYGLRSDVKFKLYKYRSAYYLKADQKIYKLDENDDYNSLEPEEDPALKNALSP